MKNDRLAIGTKLIVILALLSTSYGFVACKGESNDGKIKYKGVSNPSSPAGLQSASLAGLKIGDALVIDGEGSLLRLQAGSVEALAPRADRVLAAVLLPEVDLLLLLEGPGVAGLRRIDLLSGAEDELDLGGLVIGRGAAMSAGPDGERIQIETGLGQGRATIFDFEVAAQSPPLALVIDALVSAKARLVYDATRDRLVRVDLSVPSLDLIDLRTGRSLSVPAEQAPGMWACGAAPTADGRILLLDESYRARLLDPESGAVEIVSFDPGPLAGVDHAGLLWFRTEATD